MLVWIISALRRTLSYLKVKRQDYKLAVMKRYALIFSIGVTTYILIRLSKVFFEISTKESDAWQHEHKFQIAWFLTFTATLFASAWVFRPTEGSKMLAEVDELLDETLTEMGEVEGVSRRLDSVEYQIEYDRRSKQRDEATSFGFQAVQTNTDPDTFKHLDGIHKGD